MISKRIVAFSVAGCLAYFLIICLIGLDEHSATYDEPIYISSGVAASEWGDFRLKLDTPPMISWLAQLGVRFYEARHQAADLAILQQGLARLGELQHYDIARNYIHSAGNVSELLVSARFPFVLLAMIGLIYTWLIARMLTNEIGGLLALAMICVDPTWQSHASVVACDVPLGAFFAMSVYHLVSMVRSRSLIHVGALSAGIALSFMTKYNAPLLLPILGGIFFLIHTPTSQTWKLLAASLVGSVLIFVAMAAFFYGSLGNLTLYFGGFGTIYQNVPESNTYYLRGEFSNRTWIHYYPLATLIKLPALHLIAITVGLAVPLIQRNQRRSLLILLIPAAVIFGVSLFDQTNYCLRRILPAYPFMYAMAGFVSLLQSWISERRVQMFRYALIAIVGLGFLINLFSYPNQMSSFSMLFGGDSCGPHLLSDCNIDWGQDLPALAEYQKKHEIAELRLRYFGQADPKSYGVSSRELTGIELGTPQTAVYAMSVNVLIYQQLEAERAGNPKLDWLARFEPTAKAGGSIYIYDFREPGRVLEK